MKNFIKGCWHRLLVALMAGTLVVTVIWTTRHRIGWPQPSSQGTAQANWVAEASEPGRLPLPDSAAISWREPSGAGGGNGWRFELFTPPLMQYDALARSFTEAGPSSPEARTAPFGLELREVKPEPFRLQLAGYFGAPDDYLVAFLRPDQPGIILLRVGDRSAELGVRLNDFTVGQVLLAAEQGVPVYDLVARAVLADERTGDDVILDNRTPRLTDNLLGICEPQAGGTEGRVLRVGDTFSDAGSVYHIEQIRLSPAEVVVTKQTPGRPEPEMAILHPVEKRDTRLADGPAHSPTGLAAASN